MVIPCKVILQDRDGSLIVADVESPQQLVLTVKTKRNTLGNTETKMILQTPIMYVDCLGHIVAAQNH